ncbi:helix-turn-helix domain-containing protein [Flavobacterium sp. GT2N3]|uniref:helix-turn-helix domain-containing protein n=1 Tax=unclassified Flavobacterium TaxID=196869 RepID=UPI003AAA5E67
MYYDKLHLFFKNKGLKQKEIAEALGYSPAMISRYLRGSDKINADFIIILIKKFPEIDLQYIFSDVKKNSTMVSEPSEDYGIKEEDVIRELELIEKKISSIRNVLARKRN